MLFVREFECQLEGSDIKGAHAAHISDPVSNDLLDNLFCLSPPLNSVIDLQAVPQSPSTLIGVLRPG